jgi:prevent-host-death family protein
MLEMYAMERYSIAEARDKFTKLVRRVEEKAPVEITRRGKTVAVLMSVEEYQRLQARQRGFWEAYEAFRDAVDLEALGVGKEDFDGLRDRSPGREVAL